VASKPDIDHAVLTIGYEMNNANATEQKKPYYIVKNSWGPSWVDLSSEAL